MSVMKSILAKVGLGGHSGPKADDPAEVLPIPVRPPEHVHITPVRLCEVYCFDNSLSMAESHEGRTRRDVLRDAFRRRVGNLRALPVHSLLLGTLRFSATFEQHLWWTSDLEAAESLSFDCEFATDGTSFVAALDGASYYLNHLETPRSTRRVVLLTDGHHTLTGDPVAAAEAVKASGAEVVCIACAPRESDVDMAMLRRMASLDDCRRPCVEFAGTPGDLIRIIDDMDFGIERWP